MTDPSTPIQPSIRPSANNSRGRSYGGGHKRGGGGRPLTHFQLPPTKNLRPMASRRSEIGLGSGGRTGRGRSRSFLWRKKERREDIKGRPAGLVSPWQVGRTATVDFSRLFWNSYYWGTRKKRNVFDSYVVCSKRPPLPTGSLLWFSQTWVYLSLLHTIILIIIIPSNLYYWYFHDK
jgi:hypothetical protein